MKMKAFQWIWLLPLGLYFGCMPKEAPVTTEEPEAHIQPGFLASAKKIGVRHPEKKGRIYSGYVTEEFDLAEMLEMNLVDSSLAYGRYEVVHSERTDEVLGALREEVRSADESDAELYRKACQLCGLDAYIDLDVMSLRMGPAGNRTGCLGSMLGDYGVKKNFADVAGRAYLVDVKTGAIVGIRRFRVTRTGKQDEYGVRCDALSDAAIELNDWIQEGWKASGSEAPPAGPSVP